MLDDENHVKLKWTHGRAKILLKNSIRLFYSDQVSIISSIVKGMLLD